MISQLARWMSLVGGLHLLGGVIVVGLSLSVAGGCIYAMTLELPVEIPAWVFGVGIGLSMLYGLFGVVALGEGGLLLKARGSLAAVAESDVADQQHLSDTFRLLKFFFALEAGLGAISVLGSMVQIGLAFASRSLVPLLETLQNGAGS